MLSRKAKYGLIAALDLVAHYEKGPRLIVDICKDNRLPKKFLETILLELKNSGILDSRKGRGGGYVLAKAPGAVKVGDIIRVIDGPLAPVRCASARAPKPCDECLDPESCGIRSVMRETRDAMSEVLDRVSLAEVARRSAAMKSDKDENAMYYI